MRVEEDRKAKECRVPDAGVCDLAWPKMPPSEGGSSQTATGGRPKVRSAKRATHAGTAPLRQRPRPGRPVTRRPAVTCSTCRGVMPPRSSGAGRSQTSPAVTRTRPRLGPHHQQAALFAREDDTPRTGRRRATGRPGRVDASRHPRPARSGRAPVRTRTRSSAPGHRIRSASAPHAPGGRCPGCRR